MKQTPIQTLNEALEILKVSRKDTTTAYAALAGYLMALADEKTANTVLKIVKGNK